LLYEVPLHERMDASTAIVEGRVVEQTAFWNDERTFIYTASVIEVFKVFKGSLAADRVEIITPGGFVGLEGMRVDPSLHLTPGDVGLFFCETARALHPAGTAAKTDVFSPYASVQGFVRYDLLTGVAHDVFRTYPDIEADLYTPLARRLGTAFRVVQPFAPPRPNAHGINKSASVVPVITSFSPASLTAGTASVLTINGSGFGATQGTSFVAFRNADAGGTNFIAPLATQYLSWSDTQIEVEVPARAGTGTFAVSVNSNNAFSASPLTVTYNLSNVTFAPPDGLGSTTYSYRPTLIDANGSGGYTARMFTDFANDADASASYLRGLDGWRNTTGFNVIIGSTSATDAASRDGVNIIRFDNGGELSAGVLGQTTSYYSGCNGTYPNMNWYVAEFDMVFDDGTTWNFGPGAPANNEYDFESVTLHEAGHAHQFGHVIDTGAVMHFAIADEQESRTPSSDDLAAGTDVMFLSATTNPCGQTGMTPEVLPVELVAFDALLEGNTVTLTWETASETNNAGFLVMRSAECGMRNRPQGDSPQVNACEWEEEGWIDGHGTTTAAQTYTYRLADMAPGRHRFRLKQIDYDGGFAYSPKVDVFVEVTGGYHLSENYPNPFNPTTTFALILSREQQVRLEIFDLLGRRVALLHEGSLVGEESHAFRFDAAALPSGIYLIRATGETFATTRPITLVK
jgi:hypothetical protein